MVTLVNKIIEVSNIQFYIIYLLYCVFPTPRQVFHHQRNAKFHVGSRETSNLQKQGTPVSCEQPEPCQSLSRAAIAGESGSRSELINLWNN